MSSTGVLQILNEHVRRDYANATYPEEWRNLPEIPTKAEIIPPLDTSHSRDDSERWDDYQRDPVYDAKPDLPKNIIDGPWPSTMEYLGAHYQILREDAIASLRTSVQEYRNNPRMSDTRETCVYTNVHIKGFQLSPLGPAFRVEFSHDRAGKQIRWEQSKRLQQGKLVALSTETEGFGTDCMMAIVAARPVIGGLDQNPPSIDLFWGDLEQLQFDPAERYIMIEARSGYFEASRHMLVALQKIALERFSLADHIVALNNDVQAPAYLQEHPYMNLKSLDRSEIDPFTGLPGPSTDESLYDVNVLDGSFPDIPNSGMDASQMSACKRMLTSSLAIVQGPPGTGKTFTSVSAIKALLENVGSDEPPIIIAAQTNHALDQLMNHIMVFQENVVRLGGRCAKENVEILKRTLFNLRTTTTDAPKAAGLRGCKVALEAKIKEIQTALDPLLSDDLISEDTFFKYGLISESQRDKLNVKGWEDASLFAGPDGGAPSASIRAWMSIDQIIHVPRTPQVNLGLPMEDVDLEFEQQQDQELEGPEGNDENDIDALQGTWVPFRRRLTGRAHLGVDRRKMRTYLSKDSLYKIPQGDRGTVYRHLEKMVNRKIRQDLMKLFREYQDLVDNYKVTKWQANIKLMQFLGIKIIGCTTTGLSKYRGLLSALSPRTLLIEEAAETLEGTVIAGMFDSLEHLILVGDHQQLQAHAHVSALEVAPYNLAVSMFERLVNNSMGFTMLNKQRRMIPSIRKLLCVPENPFYKTLSDHPSVLSEVHRPPVPGMGEKNTYFFHHNWPEACNSDSSRYNFDEAEMITAFFNHLVLNGTEPKKITVLTFYNGQRKTILKALKNHQSLRGHTYFNVFTVDSYQGEENDIILLSLVRSNDYLNIGFLDSKNRLVVALSRARRGLYIFGNAITLTTGEATEEGIGRNPLWDPLTRYMNAQGQLDIDQGLPITCQNHRKVMHMMNADDFIPLAGGCDRKCEGILPCNHECPYMCHPFDHEKIVCEVPCKKSLHCGHGCGEVCGRVCKCVICPDPKDLRPPVETSAAKHHSEIRNGHFNRRSESESPRKNTRFANPEMRNERGRNLAGTYKQRQNSPFRAHLRNRTQNGSRSSNESRSNNLGETPRIGSPGASSPSHSSPGNPKNWQEFNAKKADQEMAMKRQLEEAAATKMDPSKLVYKEKYRQTTVKNGVRIPGKVSERVVPRVSAKPTGTNGREIHSTAAENSPLKSNAAKPLKGELPFGMTTKPPKGNAAKPRTIPDEDPFGMVTMATQDAAKPPPTADEDPFGIFDDMVGLSLGATMVPATSGESNGASNPTAQTAEQEEEWLIDF